MRQKVVTPFCMCVLSMILASFCGKGRGNNRSLDINRYVRSYTDAGSYIKKWHKNRQSYWKPATYRTYEGHLKNFILPFFERNPCDIADIRLDSIAHSSRLCKTSKSNFHFSCVKSDRWFI
jgi:hypothetical protein